jgi:16S rRNA (cytosine967-C5)-methyltransferase
VRRGGLLIYATCSVLRAEDEEITSRFLASGEPFEPVPPADLFGKELAEAIDAGLSPSATEEPLSPGLRSANALRLWPQRHGTDGFFAMGLRRR